MCKTLSKHNDQKHDLMKNNSYKFITWYAHYSQRITHIYTWYLHDWERKWQCDALVVAWKGKGLSWIIKPEKLFSQVDSYILLKNVKAAHNWEVFIRLFFYVFRGNH